VEECVKLEWSEAFPKEFQLGVEPGFCRRKGGRHVSLTLLAASFTAHEEKDSFFISDAEVAFAIAVDIR
jgi:hypothetical protein